MWDEFINLSEDEQEKLLGGASSKQEEDSSGCETGVDRKLTKEGTVHFLVIAVDLTIISMRQARKISCNTFQLVFLGQQWMQCTVGIL